MSLTSTISSYFCVKIFRRWSRGSSCRPENSSAYIRATRAGVSQQALAIRVLADGGQDFPHRRFDPGQIDSFAVGAGLAGQIRFGHAFVNSLSKRGGTLVPFIVDAAHARIASKSL